ncbi:MAG: DUF6495 family protein [Bacteroidota bacterium]
MKYARLSKEQFEELHPEFVNFLATQQITADEWTALKQNKPEVAEQELDIFSDLIWEGVLNRAKYLQNTSSGQLFLFELGEHAMHLILVKVTDPAVDLSTQEGLTWLQQHWNRETVEFFTSSKNYSEEKNKDIFALIRQGGEIVDGSLYRALHELLNA